MHRDWHRRTRKWKRRADYESYRLRELSCRHERRKRGCVDDNDGWSMRVRLVPRNSQFARFHRNYFRKLSSRRRENIKRSDITLHFFFRSKSAIWGRGGPRVDRVTGAKLSAWSQGVSVEISEETLGLETAVLCQSKRTLRERIT